MSLYLVRHASAGDRFRWSGDDLERPLDDRGRAEAEAVAECLADRSVTKLVSSRATRCTQTLAPLAHRLGLDIEIEPALLEGTSGDESAGLARSLVAESTVLCSHGDVLPAMVRALTLDGMRIVGARGCEKGSIWELEVRGGDIVSGNYLGPPRR
ncbi:MAG: SixA phosphatase family protein [Acidimicrobiales bacterium]